MSHEGDVQTARKLSAVLAIDSRGLITAWGHGAKELYGWTTAEALGREARQLGVLIPASDDHAEGVIPPVRWSGEMTLRRRNGQSFLAQASITPIRAQDGSLNGAVCVLQEIAASRPAGGATVRFGRLLDRSPNEIYIFDARTLHFTLVNRGALANLGYTLSEMRALTPLDLKLDFTAESFEALVEPLRSGESEQVVFRTKHTRKDGTAYPVEVRLSLAHDEVPQVFVAVIDDLTDRQRLEDELNEVNLAKDALLEELADERNRLKDLIQNIPGVAWEARGEPGSPGYQVTFMSSQVEAVLGYSAERLESLKGDGAFATIHPDDRLAVVEAAASAYNEGSVSTVRFRWMAADGRPVWTESHFSPIRSDGAAVGLRGVNFVVDKQQRREELLNFVIEAGRVLASSLDYRVTLDSVAQLAVPKIADWCAIHVIDANGELNPVSVAHVDPQRVAWVREMQTKYRDAVGPSTRTVGPELVVRTGKAQFFPEVTQRMVESSSPDPEVRSAIEQVRLRSYMCVPMELQGDVLGAITFATAESGRQYDELDLRAAEHLARRAAAAVSAALRYEEAEKERARFATIFTRMDRAVCQLDRDARFEHVNPAAEAILGAPESELQGHDFHAVVHRTLDGSPCDLEDCSLSQGVLGTDPYRGDEVFTSVTGRAVPVRVGCTPVLVAGQAVGVIVSFEDVTAQQETNLRKDNFLAYAAHELRTPLTPIIGLARWLNREVKKEGRNYSEDLVDVADTLSTESERLANVIEVFLDLSRIESNRLTAEPGPCDICEVILLACGRLRSRYKAAKVEMDLQAESYQVLTDEARLSQVLTNLLENAAKYGGDPPHITVSLRIEDSRLRIGVRDRGAGILEEDQPRIFERFYRSSSVTGKKGTGVGLYLAREIVNQLGGELTFTSCPAKAPSSLSIYPTLNPRCGEPPCCLRVAAD